MEKLDIFQYSWKTLDEEVKRTLCHNLTLVTPFKFMDIRQMLWDINPQIKYSKEIPYTVIANPKDMLILIQNLIEKEYLKTI